MIELQKFIVGELKKVSQRVFLEQAADGAAFPYVVYRLPISDENNRREDFMLEIDMWDRPANGSTVALQNLSDAIDNALNRLIYTDSAGWNARFYRVNRLMVPDPDAAIRRRQLRYEVKVYRRDT